MKQRTLMGLSILALVGDCYLSLCFKGHYSIDNFGGLILGAHIWLCSNNWLSYYVDVKLFGMTLHERFPDQIQTECSNCGEDINKWCQVKELRQQMKLKEAGQCYHEELETKESEDSAKNQGLIEKNLYANGKPKSDASSTQSGDALF